MSIKRLKISKLLLSQIFPLQCCEKKKTEFYHVFKRRCVNFSSRTFLQIFVISTYRVNCKTITSALDNQYYSNVFRWYREKVSLLHLHPFSKEPRLGFFKPKGLTGPQKQQSANLRRLSWLRGVDGTPPWKQSHQESKNPVLAKKWPFIRLLTINGHADISVLFCMEITKNVRRLNRNFF